MLATYFDFKVVGTFIACRTSCLARIAIDFAGRTFILGPGDAVESGWTGGNMNTLDLPFNYPNIQVVDNGDHISVTLGNGVSVQWDKHKSAIIEVPESYMNSGQGKYNAILPKPGLAHLLFYEFLFALKGSKLLILITIGPRTASTIAIHPPFSKIFVSNAARLISLYA